MSGTNDLHDKPVVAYFGCNGRAGHHLLLPHKNYCRDGLETEWHNIPKEHDLDGNAMFLPRAEVVGTGHLTYLPAMRLHVLAWWGSPWDMRGKVNSAVMVRTETGMGWPPTQVERVALIWGRFCAAFPDISSKLVCPKVIS